MRALGAAEVLQVWEIGRGQLPAERALTLLARACPERGRDGLLRLPLGHRDRLLLEARAAAFGPTLHANATCPGCGETVEFRLAIDDLLAAEAGDAAAGGSEELAAAGHELRFRRLDSADLLAAAACSEADAARALLVERCVLAARRDGTAVPPEELTAEAVAALAERLAAADPCLETLLDLTCPSCGDGWRADLDLESFVWQEIHSRAGQLFDEVDTLARTYGWSEGEILALDAERRRAYLDRVLG